METGEISTSQVSGIDFGEGSVTESQKLIPLRVKNILQNGKPDEIIDRLSELKNGLNMDLPGTAPLESFKSDLEQKGESEAFVLANKIAAGYENSKKLGISSIEKDYYLGNAAMAEQLSIVSSKAEEVLRTGGLLPESSEKTNKEISEIIPVEIRRSFNDGLKNENKDKLEALGQVYPLSYDLMAKEAGKQIVEQVKQGGNVEQGRDYLLKIPGYEKQSDGKVAFKEDWRSKIINKL